MPNLGTPDRIIRVIVGLALVTVPFLTGWTLWPIVAAVAGVVLVATAAISFCPIYALFGLSSKRRSAR